MIRMMMDAATHEKDTTFILSDTQIIKTSFLEDINNMLNTGEIPNLFKKKEDLDELTSSMRILAKKKRLPDTPEGLYALFISLVKKHIHIILCMSPVGGNLRICCRKFPSLINCCTLDWFQEWPEDAMISVSNSILEGVEISDKKMKKDIGVLCMEVNQDVKQLSKDFYNE